MQKTEIIKKSTVALVRCDTYNEAEVNAAVEKGFTLLGGPSAFFKKDEKIVLKPNLLAGVAPEHCVTTHPAVFGSVIKVLREVGIVLSYGDSPAIHKVEKAVKTAGLYAVAQQYAIPLTDFERGRKVTHLKAISKGSFSIANGVLDADGLVSICKLKTHGFTRFTGAVKNQFGCVPGLTKPRYHAQIHLVNDFCAFMVDINTFLRPRFFIMDAIMAMEGNGPNSGDPKKLGCLLFSADPVALDAVACKIIDIKPEYIPTCRIGEKAGLGTCNFDTIEVVGDPVEECIDKTFKIVRKPPFFGGSTGVSRSINTILMPKPVINSSMCTKCSICIEICPVEPKALYWRESKESSNTPTFNYSQCIRCFCCQETCPEKAISIKTSALGKILPGVVLFGMLVGSIKSLFKRFVKKMKGIVKL